MTTTMNSIVEEILKPFYHTGMKNFCKEKKSRFVFVQDNQCVDFKNMRWLNNEEAMNNGSGYYIHFEALSKLLKKLNIKHNVIFDKVTEEFVLLSDMD